MLKNEFPILEYDADKNAFIRPEMLHKRMDIPERIVLCFFAETIEKFLKSYPHKIVTKLGLESVYVPVYEFEYRGERIALVQMLVGAPLAAAYIEELSALGCRKFIACGGCGVLKEDIAVGHLFIPVSAVRDEGTSYHYAPPSREISMSETAVKAVEKVLSDAKVPFIKAKTWTTDAFFRETPTRITRRKEEGCVTVEMEASAFIAAAKYNEVEFGQLLYAGDSLADEEWDNRGWNSRTDIRESVLRLALDACLAL